MALKLKQYTPTYKGLDADYYMNRKAPIITIITNRNTGKTTNVFGWLIEKKSHFLYSPDTRTNRSSPDTSFWQLQSTMAVISHGIRK